MIAGKLRRAKRGYKMEYRVDAKSAGAFGCCTSGGVPLKQRGMLFASMNNN